MRKKVTALFLSFLLIFAATACTGDPSEDGSDVNTMIISINIVYPEGAQKENVVDYEMQVQEDATVMQILESYSNQEGIETVVDTADTPYVTSIDGVKAEGSSRWIYEVNDEKDITKAAAEYKVKDGDTIIWKYIAF